MIKRSLSIFFLLCLVLMIVFPVLASAEGSLDQCLESGVDCEVVNQEIKDSIQKAKDEAGIMEGFLIGRVQDLFHIGGINSIPNLVFGNPYAVWAEGQSQKVYYNLFYEKELTTFIKPLLSLFAACYVSFVALAIMISALRMGFKAYSPQAKADFWNDVQMWVISAFFMGTFTWFVEAMFGLNEGITQSVKNVAEIQMGVQVTDMSIIAFAKSQGLLEDPVALLGNLLVMLGEWVLALYLNFVYIARKIIIILLMIIAPVAAISLLYAKTRAFFGSWLKELAGNIFLQSIHAIVLGVFAGMASLGAGMILKLGMLIMFIPITGMISKWLNLGDSSSAVGRVATMAGVSGIGGAIMLAKGARNVMSHKGGNAPQSFHGTGADSNSNPANDGATTDLTAAASGSHSSGWQKTRSFAAGVGGIAGAVAGLPLGGPGVAIGGYLGSKIGKGVLQTGRNMSGGLTGVGHTLASPLEHASDGNARSWSSWKDGYGRMWGDLSERRKFIGNAGEALGSVVGLGSVGRSVGHMISGASRNRVMVERFGNRTLEDHMRETPGAQIQWRQDNQGSAYYKKQGNAWVQISPYGAANPSLKKGEVLKMDYQLNDGSEWNRQENGTFTTTAPSTSVSEPTIRPIYGSDGQVLSTVESPSGTHERPGGRQIVGLSGSTPHLGRTSGVYLEGADGKRLEDTRVNPKSINPDAYFAHHVAGTPDRRTLGDKDADVISATRRRLDHAHHNLQSWREGLGQQNKSRHKGIV